MNYIYYKNYEGSAKYSEEDQIFHGKITGNSVLISYEGGSLADLIEDFCNSVDDYLEFCQERRIEPQLQSVAKGKDRD
ncbi:hypothetical protein [Macellibacteroides fermentans]|uniref:hypothetical protein n=1 Tax=Macellibacteroides fermentans TaxID=879969 RepID=UPI00406C89A1